MPPKTIATNKQPILNNAPTSHSSTIPEDSKDCLTPEINPILLPDQRVIHNSLQLLSTFCQQQLENAKTLEDMEIYGRSIINFCQDARKIVQFVVSAEKQKAELTTCAKGYFNRKHPQGLVFYQATVRLIDRLTGSSQGLLLPTATRVSVNERSRNLSFLSSSQSKIIAKPEPLHDSLSSNNSI